MIVGRREPIVERRRIDDELFAEVAEPDARLFGMLVDARDVFDAAAGRMLRSEPGRLVDEEWSDHLFGTSSADRPAGERATCTLGMPAPRQSPRPSFGELWS